MDSGNEQQLPIIVSAGDVGVVLVLVVLVLVLLLELVVLLLVLELVVLELAVLIFSVLLLTPPLICCCRRVNKTSPSAIINAFLLR